MYAIIIRITFLFLKCFCSHMSHFGWTLVPLFWISDDSCSRLQSQSSCLIYIAEANVLHVPWDPPTVLHLLRPLTVTWLMVQSPHISIARRADVSGDKIHDLMPRLHLRAFFVCERFFKFFFFSFRVILIIILYIIVIPILKISY